MEEIIGGYLSAGKLPKCWFKSLTASVIDVEKVPTWM